MTGGPDILWTLTQKVAASASQVSSGEMVVAIDDLLRLLADETGNGDFLRAANALHRQPAGRPSIDDVKLIEEALWLHRNGKAKTVNQALTKVAQTVAVDGGVKSVAERLRRKMHATAKSLPRNSFSGSSSASGSPPPPTEEKR